MRCSAADIPVLAVGILRAPQITVTAIKAMDFDGTRTFSLAQLQGRSLWIGTDESVFDLHDVVIGIGFHWQRCQVQRFTGRLQLIPDGDCIVAVNHVDVESYLRSVISSEMSATASPALLRAHAVISRSWVLRQIDRRPATHHTPVTEPDVAAEDAPTVVRWYDHDDHTLFDVCADDHCQRYQGITRIVSDEATRAVDDTRGEVLTYGGVICDARFSKCCGGVTETFENCWEPLHHAYLQALVDAPGQTLVPDLTTEAAARRWIDARHDSFCNCSDDGILRQVLNNYDRETPDFYRWRVDTDGRQLGQLIREKAGIDLGDVVGITPLVRGASGRITRLRIDGTLGSRIVGKELEIRRWLSPTHLYSSAFYVVTADPDGDGVRRFTFVGAGWGHGVGLCQIGAAVMGARGYTYRDILAHYYPTSTLTTAY